MEMERTLGLINRAVRDLDAYHLAPSETPIKLNQNESPFDWPEEVKEEAARFCRERPWNRYPDFVPKRLHEDLASYAGATPEQILAGNGSNEVLLVLLVSLMNRAAPVIICEPTFAVYRMLITGLGGTVESVFSADDLTFDTAALKSACRNNPGSLLIAASPNSPTGSALSESQVREVLDVHEGFVVLDQAYAEFGGFSAVELCAAYPNLLVTRTFSKALAGAGLRLGYLVGSPEVVREIRKIKLPYNINFFSEFVASLLSRRRELIRERVRLICTERDRLYRHLRSLPLDMCYPSEANFILVRTSKCEALKDFLSREGILVRDVSSYPLLKDCLRISVGTPRHNEILRKKLDEFFSTVK